MNTIVARVPIVIPAYEPDDRLILLINQMIDCPLGPIIICDDGSGEDYKTIFEQAKMLIEEQGGTVIHHDINMGKGKALKTAFEYIINFYPNVIGCVTADSDGQHTAKCILQVAEALMKNPDNLILGVRKFRGEDIPWKSKFGNSLTEKVFSYATGIHVSDTQTGLRGIPVLFMKQLLNVPGERFEFETQMLLESIEQWPIVEVSIETIYDSKENHQTHFNPILDSIKIYRVLGKRFIKYVFSSLSSSIIDIVLFWLLCNMLKTRVGLYIAMATVLARIISATYNYLMNYKIVFHSQEKYSSSALKYIVLAITQMTLSAVLVTTGTLLIPLFSEVIWKVLIDTVLFFISYHLQQNFVFHKFRKEKK